MRFEEARVGRGEIPIEGGGCGQRHDRCIVVHRDREGMIPVPFIRVAANQWDEDHPDLRRWDEETDEDRDDRDDPGGSG